MTKKDCSLFLTSTGYLLWSLLWSAKIPSPLQNSLLKREQVVNPDPYKLIRIRIRNKGFQKLCSSNILSLIHYKNAWGSVSTHPPLLWWCRRFTMKTVLMLADQMIGRIEYVHNKNFIHRYRYHHHYSFSYFLLYRYLESFSLGYFLQRFFNLGVDPH